VLLRAFIGLRTGEIPTYVVPMRHARTPAGGAHEGSGFVRALLLTPCGALGETRGSSLPSRANPPRAPRSNTPPPRPPPTLFLASLQARIT
jgi:hypothetical protein